MIQYLNCKERQDLTLPFPHSDLPHANRDPDCAWLCSLYVPPSQLINSLPFSALLWALEDWSLRSPPMGFFAFWLPAGFSQQEAPAGNHGVGGERGISFPIPSLLITDVLAMAASSTATVQRAPSHTFWLSQSYPPPSALGALLPVGHLAGSC